jgi:hypothetical protein
MWTSLIPLPYRWAIIAALFASAVGFGWVKGAAHDHAKWEAADALRAKQDAAHLAADAARTKADSDKLRALFDTAAELRAKDTTDHEKQLETLRAAARAGTERLRCPAAALPADTETHDPAAAARSEPEAGRDSIVPGTADALFRIAAGIRRGVRERNALIDAYQAARATCSAP